MFKFFLPLIISIALSIPTIASDDIKSINDYCIQIDTISLSLVSITVSGNEGEDIVAYYNESDVVRIFIDYITYPKSKRLSLDYYIKSGRLLKVTQAPGFYSEEKYSELFYKNDELIHAIINDEEVNVYDYKIESRSQRLITKLDEFLLLIQ